MDITSYDPKKVTIVAGGRAVTGCATDGMVTATHNEDRATTAVGAQGDIAYSENANNSGTVTVSLMSTSSSLAYLRDLCARRVEFPLNIADANDADSIHISEERCRILKFPDLSRAKEQATVTIDIFVPDLNYR